jgi:hypothetical protein
MRTPLVSARQESGHDHAAKADSEGDESRGDAQTAVRSMDRRRLPDTASHHALGLSSDAEVDRAVLTLDAEVNRWLTEARIVRGV